MGFLRPNHLGSMAPPSPSGSSLRSPTGLSEYVARNPMEVSYRAEREGLPPLTPLSTSTQPLKGVTYDAEASIERQTLVNSWLFEFLWILISIVCFAVIVIVLLIYDHQSIPSLPLNITLNTFVAFFATISKAAFMIPIAEAISQCKWNWFRGNQPLSDFETFDQASRGFWGSLFLLNRVRWRNIASLGAIVTILSFLSSPITQQVIAYPSRLGLSPVYTNVTTAAVQTYGHNPDIGKRGVTMNQLTAVLNSFLQPVNTPIEPLEVNCPTGQCTFPLFNSLGMCVQIADITSKLNVKEEAADPNSWILPLQLENTTTTQYNVSLPSRLGDCNMSIPSTLAFRSCLSYPDTSLAFEDNQDLMASKVYSFSLIYSTANSDTFENKTNPKPVQWKALEAFYHMCVRTYNITVSDGKTMTKAVSSSWAQPVNNTNTPLTTECNEMTRSEAQLQCITPKEDLEAGKTSFISLANPAKPDSQDPKDHFRVQRSTLFPLVDAFNYASEGMYIFDPVDGSDQGWAISSGNTQIIEALYNNNDNNIDEAPPLEPAVQMERLTTIFNNVATGVTNLMRTTKPVPAWMEGTENVNSFAVSGSAWTFETFVSVRWGWIAYMAVEILLATLFLALTVAYTRRLNMHVLKSSPLATLLALNDETRLTVGGITTPKRFRSNARTVKVNLVGNDLGVAEFVPSPVERTGSQDSMEKEKTSPTVGVRRMLTLQTSSGTLRKM